MAFSSVLLCVLLCTPSVAAQDGIIERLLVAAQQRPWLWSVLVFAVGLPIILFISFMWPDMRFGPPDQQYYYKKCDDVQTDDPDSSPHTDSSSNQTLSQQTNGGASTAGARRRDGQKKSDLDLKVQ